jgi:DNA/RNA endonuclease YhcR with UshA esterase domain
MRSKKQLRRVSLGGLLLGLFLLNLYMVRREPPLLQMGEIKPIHNFSRVRVQGLLKTDARILRGGSLFYLLVDETGSLPLFLDRAPEGKLPKAGSTIEATGRLRVGSGHQISMHVHDPKWIKITEQKSVFVTVRGQVQAVWNPPPDSNAPHRITLERPEGRIEIVFWFPLSLPIKVGDQLEATGRLGFYNGRMQLKVRDPQKILQVGRPHPRQ